MSYRLQTLHGSRSKLPSGIPAKFKKNKLKVWTQLIPLVIIMSSSDYTVQTSFLVFSKFGQLEILTTLLHILLDLLNFELHSKNNDISLLYLNPNLTWIQICTQKLNPNLTWIQMCTQKLNPNLTWIQICTQNLTWT